MNVIFASALFVGAAAIACWIVARFPKLAPPSLIARGVGAFASVQLLGVVNVTTTTMPKLYVSLFVLLLPALTLTWLSVLWLLQGLQEVSGSMR